MRSFLISLLLLSSLSFSACDFFKQDSKDEELEALQQQVEALEQQLADQESTETEPEDTTVEEQESEILVEEAVESSLTLNSPKEGDIFFSAPIEFKGTVSSDAQKIVVTWTYSGFSEKGDRSIDTDVYTLQNFSPGDTTYTYRAKEDWDNLGVGQNDYVIRAYYQDGSERSVELSIHYDVGGMGKPVVYLYPEVVMPVFVKVEPELGLFVSDPVMGQGWNVLAHPSGKILNLMDRKIYPYLFWEGYSRSLPDYEEGFVVAEQDLAAFFDAKLAVLGLNPQEIRDFEEYWLDRLAGSPYSFIHFVDQAIVDEMAPLTIQPHPDSVIRVYFDHRALEHFEQVPEQVLFPAERHGFSVVEWGGSLWE